MYVVSVLFTLKPEHTATFLEAMIHNANTSLAVEPGCRQFDVCVPHNGPNEVFLYEIYDSKAAFAGHLVSDHFQVFNTLSAPWVANKVVHTMQRVSPARPSLADA